MALISVIVPVYKVEAYLDRCIESILNQSFTDFELILVDDGSPDRCGEICDGYAGKDSRIHVIHRENGGLSAARNSAIDWMQENSQSQWLTFVDSDDWIEREYLHHLYTAARISGARMAACEYYMTQGQSQEPEEAFCVCTLTADDYYCGSGQTSSPIACAKLYHRSLFQTIRFPEGKLHEDEFTTYKTVYLSGTVAKVPMQLYAYYQNPDGIILSKWNPRRLHIVEAFQQQIRDAEEQHLDRLYRNAVEGCIYAVHAQLGAAEECYHRQLRKTYREVLRLGRKCGAFPLDWDSLWAYEEAYPVKLFWWCLFRGRRWMDRLFGKEAVHE